MTDTRSIFQFASLPSLAKCGAVLAIGLSAAVAQANSVAVYDSVGASFTSRADKNSGFVSFGDIDDVSSGDITLTAGSPRMFDSFSTALVNTGTAASAFKLTLSVFDAAGKSILWSATSDKDFMLGAGEAGQFDVTGCLKCGPQELPDSFYYELTASNPAGLGIYSWLQGDAGSILGTSNNTDADGKTYADALTINAVNNVPEPSSLVLALTAVGLLGAIKKRGAKA